MSLLAVVLLLSQAADPSPAAHNQAAMMHFKRGDLEAAYAEFTAAYAASPDPAGDRTAREAAMGSRRSVLLALHARDRRNPEPLCRLASDLRGHIAALVAAHPGEPELLEVVGNQERLTAVTRDLEPFGVEACVAKQEIPLENSSVGSPDIAEGTEETTVTIPTPTPDTPRSADTSSPRRLKIAGGVTLGLGGLALVGSATAAALFDRRYRHLDALDRWLADPSEVAEKEHRAHDARVARTAAIVTGSLAGVLIVAGVAVLVKAVRRPKHASITPALGTHAWGIHFMRRF